MSRIVVAGIESNAGASTVAVGLAHRLAYAGRSVRLERLAGDARAEADARTFGLIEFVDASGQPVAESAVAADTAATVTIIEAPAGGDAAALAQRLSARLVLVGPAAPQAGAGATVILNHQVKAGALALAEDRLLAAPTVATLIEASGAQVLSRSEDGDAAICEHLVVAAISHDAADAYYARFPRRAVVCRSERVDLALAAMSTGTELLILTGGAEPSPYLLDRAAASRATTLLLAPDRTVETVRDIEGVFSTSPFSHEAKVERAGALIAAAIDDATLAALAG
ncbi:MAG: DRTGG domain-containing protein [Chloroflexi bacterium]|nr:DRTGG domain-containing protein [Chloroflexota bacterium]MDA1240412.1 DRTGG domain-containing protein [Chloroflexota bacterium]